MSHAHPDWSCHVHMQNAPCHVRRQVASCHMDVCTESCHMGVQEYGGQGAQLKHPAAVIQFDQLELEGYGPFRWLLYPFNSP